jgi:thymidine kinase
MYSLIGNIHAITGPMSCGKSEVTMTALRRGQIARRRVLLIRPLLDTRTSSDVARSRSGASFPAISLSHSADISNAVRSAEADLVAVEEAQFWDDGLPDALEDLAAHGVSVIVNGLNQDFAGRPFGPMPQILARADNITSLCAICTVCGAEASKTFRCRPDGSPAAIDDPVILVGGLDEGEPDRYEARCRSHHSVRSPRPSVAALPDPII